jgi:predicted dehydrogenase
MRSISWNKHSSGYEIERPMAKIRVGIVGSGFGGVMHAPAYHAHEAFEPVAIASPHNAEKVARERKIPNAFASLEQMLDSVQLDAVSIAPPPFAHHDATLLALERGKHVLCEKPLALTVEEAEAMVAAAKRSQGVCGIAFEFRFDASRQALKELVVNRHLGPLREIEFTQLTTMLRADGTRKRGWWFEKRRGGGMIQAFGSHMIDSVVWLAGRPPTSYVGFSRTANPNRRDAEGPFTSDVADGMFALLDFGDGLVGRLTLDATNVVNSATLAVYGEERTAAATGEGPSWAKLFTIDAKETSEHDLAGSPYDHLRSVHVNLPQFMLLLDQFAAAIEGKPNALPTFEDGLLVQRVMAAVGYEPLSAAIRP